MTRDTQLFVKGSGMNRLRLNPRGINRRQLLSRTASAGVVASLPFAPAIGQGKRQDIRVGIWGGDFGNLSPAIRWTVPAGLVMNPIFDGLVRVDYVNRMIVPWLAQEWTNPDPLTWRFRLREGVLWHGDYGEFTAEDVVYTWRHHFDTSSFMVGSALFPIDTAVADGKYVVEVKTKTPFGAFPGSTMAALSSAALPTRIWVNSSTPLLLLATDRTF